MSTGGGREIRAGKAFVELGVRDRLKGGLAKAAGMLRSFGTTVTAIGARLSGIGAIITGPLLLALKVATSIGDAMANSAKRTQMSVEAFSELKYAMEQSGGTAEDLEAGLLSMQKVISKAGKGNKSASAALATLGLSFSELEKLSPEKQFEILSDAIMAIENPTERATLALQVFGKFGNKLLPLFSRGAKDIAALRERARELGIVMAGEDASALAKLGNLMSDVWQQVKFVQVAIASALAPVLTEMVNRITRVLAVVIKWIRLNQYLVVWAAKIGAAFLIAGAAFVAVGAVAFGLAAAITGVVVVAAKLAAIVMALVPLFALLATPVGYTVVVLTELTAAFLVFSGIGSSLLQWLSGLFVQLWRTATQTLRGIADALLSGEFKLAAGVMWAGILVEWLKGTRDIKMATLQLKFYILRAFDDLQFGITSVWMKIATGAKIAALKMVTVFTQAIRSMVDMSDPNTIGGEMMRGLFGNVPVITDDMFAAGTLDIGEQAKREADNLAELQRQVHEARLRGALDEAEDLDQQIAATQTLLDLLSGLAEQRRNEFDAIGPPPIPEDPLFPGFDGLANGIKNGATSVGAFGGGGGLLGRANPFDAFKQMAKGIENVADGVDELVSIARESELVFG